ncbi:MAG: HDOD domain-containing protein [Pseudomonadota bacterium]
MDSELKFKFVKSLAIDLNRGEIALPSFPDIVVRIRAALDDPDCSGEQLAAIIGTEPVLASRMLILANSAAYNPGGTKISNLPATIARIGFAQVRSAAITHAMDQLHSATELKPIRPHLHKNWVRGLRLAALAEVLAARAKGLNANDAFIAGLMSPVDELYVLTKHGDYPDLLTDLTAREEIVAEFGAGIARSIVEHWNFPDEIVNAVSPADDPQSEMAKASLADAVVAAKTALAGDEVCFADCPSLTRLGVDVTDPEPLLAAYNDKLTALRAAVAA